MDKFNDTLTVIFYYLRHLVVIVGVGYIYLETKHIGPIIVALLYLGSTSLKSINCECKEDKSSKLKE